MYLFVVLGLFILQKAAAIIVPVEQGLLEGEQKWTITGNTLYNSFKGIPYAAPPTGELRFKAPQPALNWEGVRNATEHGSFCPQVDQLTNKFLPGSEDCLFLNVYTPNINTDDSLKPVMVFIHGGSYAFGSGNDENYASDYLIDKNVVVVTLNYRLDSLGFLCLDTKEVPGNAGLKDQVAALKWVQKNIENFGGDSNQVTIFGQSAGAVSCFLHALSPMSKGLFHRVIAMSGVPISDFSVEFESKRRAMLLGKSLGIETTNTTAFLELLQDLPAKKLIGTNPSVIAIEEYINLVMKLYFVPVVEKDYGQERFLIDQPDVLLRNGRMHDVDVLLGYASAEGIVGIFMYEKAPTIENYERFREALVPRNILYQSKPTITVELGDLIKEHYSGSEPLSLKTMPQFVNFTSHMFTYGVLRFAKHLSNAAIDNIYLYQFSCMSERNILSQQGTKYGINGVSHNDDLMYVFNPIQYNLPMNKSAPSYKMIENTCTLLTNFAKYGNPTPDSSLGVEWPKYTAETETFMDIGEELTIDTKPRACMMDFWQRIYERADIPF
ncbi:juvenile hormone esterase-like [Pararge aegeria]|uniref:juvenile hormone esterase-like n=1 Tax=Pararge aegeria TaxID=116150 RepID=UPI0019D306DF|nr:juvenile hormone esterase-like [Pararge aegeria]